MGMRTITNFPQSQNTAMKTIVLLFTVLITATAFSQSKYDHRKAFDPNFYTSGGNDYRSASGEPGPKYWQNRADYNLVCTLDTLKHGVNGTVEISYTSLRRGCGTP